MRPIVRVQLSIMMFLQYAIWGAWGVTMSSYLMSGEMNFRGTEVGWVYNTSQIAAILSPLLLGLIADRFFATQTVISVCHLAGAGLLFAAAEARDPRSVFLLMLAYALLYMPTLALTNAISFRNMTDPDRQFPAVRVLGTIGWIAAQWTVTLTGIGPTNMILYLAGSLSVWLGVFSVFLPHTPPLRASDQELSTNPSSLATSAAPAAARRPGMFATLAMFKDPSFAILMLLSFGISVALAFYYQLGNPFVRSLPGVTYPEFWQSTGQISEILFMLGLPFVVATLGVKWTLLLGMLAWCARYGIFWSQSVPLVLFIGLPLHGICYDFFFVTSQLYVDSRAPRALRASAQGLLTLVTLGLGMFVGNGLAGFTADFNKTPPIEDLSLWKAFVPTFLFDSGEPVADTVVRTIHWPGVWLPAAIGCAIAVILFFVGFREPKKAANNIDYR